jgi:thiamine biosynthesis lipoprotein
MSSPSRPRTLHVEHCMGTVFTIGIRDAGVWDHAVDEVVDWLHHVDEVFSTYKPDSDISRLRRGELKVDVADSAVSTVLELCAEAQATTEGHFTAMPDGRVDPTGLVKGWAIEEASRRLSARGAANHAVNGGGDMQLVGDAAPGRPWTVGISDPADRSQVVALVRGRNLAVATSGVSERGAHIVDPFSGRPARALASATVVGPSLTRADAYATAAFVMGVEALQWISGVPDYEALLIGTDGTMRESRGWRAATTIVPAAAERVPG